MTGFEIIALLLTVTALFSYINYRFLKLPTTIGVMLMALLLSLGLVALDHCGFHIIESAEKVIADANLDATLMQGMLSFLLFAGALHINLNDLAEQKIAIFILSTAGVVLSTAAMGTGLYFALQALNVTLSYTYCLLFGALISPTDPVAVLAILKTVKVPRSLEIKIAGESLFNDGIGVIAFIMLSEVALQGGGHVTVSHIGRLFLQEAIGGAAYGLVIGWIAYRLLKSVDNYQVEVLITLGLVSGGYASAAALHTSGPIAIVVAGVLIGNHGRRFAMSDRTRQNLDLFWELVDEILNAVLFVLIGLEVLHLKFTVSWLTAGFVAIPILLLARWISVVIPITTMRLWRTFSPGAVAILTWAGLRGGIPVALALSLPPGAERDLLLAITYVVVVFSILVQGLTIQPLIKKFYPAGQPRE
jgi:CPA1 family monovalent cation:H+ antiporter